MAQDCATAPTAVIGANAFDTTASAVNVAMPAGSGCATAHTIYKVGYYKFTAATAGVHTIAFCGGATFDTRVAVLNTCVPAGGVLACNDDSCGLQSQTAVNLTAGQQCVILLGGYGATNFGAGSFTITEPTAGVDQAQTSGSLGDQKAPIGQKSHGPGMLQTPGQHLDSGRGCSAEHTGECQGQGKRELCFCWLHGCVLVCGRPI
jgi:hypothetical protein